MRNITKFKRSIRGISPVISVLLMIAIAVVASLVAYAWVMGYMSFQTNKVGQSIQIPSFALDSSNQMLVYVQNIGQGTAQIGIVYIDGEQKADFTNDQTKSVAPGSTVELKISGTYDSSKRYEIKVTTKDGTSMTTTGKPGTGGAITPAHGDATGITVSPDSVTLMASTTQAFTATATDGTVNWDVTDLATWAVTPVAGGTFSGNVLTAGTVGTGYTVTATYDSGTGALTDNTPLTVLEYHGAMTGITITPASAQVQTGTTQAFTATATDGTVNWDVTDLATWAVTPVAGGTFSGNVLTAGTVGTGYTVTATVSAIDGSTSLQVTPAGPGPLHHFTITVPASCNSHEYFGISRNVVVTAYDASGAVKTDYTGSIWFMSSDTEDSVRLPFDNNPSSDKYQFTTGDAGSHTFTSTSSSGFRLITTPSQTITVTDGTISEESSAITVNPGSVDYFTFSNIGNVNEGTYFSVTITAKDQDGNTVTTYSGTQTLTENGASSVQPTSVTFANGVWTGNVRVYVSSTSWVTLYIGSSASNTFRVYNS